MSETNGIKEAAKPKMDAPILQLNRLNYVKIGGRVLDSTEKKLDKYIKYASERMKTEVTSGDCLEHGLKLLFDRDAGFKEWLKQN
jgi:hypothetical protein